MRAAFFWSVALASAVACTSFSGSDAPTQPTTQTEAGSDAGGTPPTGSDAAPDAGGLPGCMQVDPNAHECFDFDTALPTNVKEVQNGVLALQGVDAGGHALLSTINATFSQNTTSGHAYYDVGIDGSPNTVHWKFDLLLNAGTLHNVDFMQLVTVDGSGDTCFFQPELSGEAAFTIVEECDSTDAPLISMTIPITQSGWWNFDLTVDFGGFTVLAVVNDPAGAPHTMSSAFHRARSHTGMTLEMGVDFGADGTQGAAYEFDNVFLYY